MAEKQKNRKQGRTRKSPANLRYIREERHSKSHVRRIASHIARYGTGGSDKVANLALRNYQIKAGIVSARP